MRWGRLIVWLIVALAVLLTVAYIDGGEEPLRPISQQITLSENA